MIQVEQDVEIGFVVVTLDLSDADTGSNAEVIFVSLEGGQNNADVFLDVDRITGRISTIRLATTLNDWRWFLPNVHNRVSRIYTY